MVEKVPLEPVVSSNIAAVGYDYARQILAIQFKTDGVIRHYAGVPVALAFDFGRAESKGRFYHAKIRGKFRGERVSGPCRNCKAEGYIGDVCARCGTAQHFGLERREEHASA